MESRRLSNLQVPAHVRAAIAKFLDRIGPEGRRRAKRWILFGSMARGEGDEASDVDLLVVWDGGLGEALDILVPAATRVLIEDRVDISVHPVPVENFNEMVARGTSFYRTLFEEGIVVAE